MAVVVEWSGVEVRAFRTAARLSMVDLAERLGVSERVVAKWESGGATARPRAVNQAALDTLLEQADIDTHARFAALLTLDGQRELRLTEPERDPVLSSELVKHPVDGKLMAEVPAGIYLGGEAGDIPRSVERFWIDAHPVTNADYARFLAATGHGPAPQHWTDGICPTALYQHPVVYVRWEDASAYAAWAGKTLPTAEQWEKAARGTVGYPWPWGADMTPAKCNVKETGVGGTSPVTRFQSGVSPFYCFDMVGNVWEWTSSATTEGRYELKGGSWASPMFAALPSRWNDANREMLDNDTGFRCVSLAEP